MPNIVNLVPELNSKDDMSESEHYESEIVQQSTNLSCFSTPEKKSLRELKYGKKFRMISDPNVEVRAGECESMLRAPAKKDEHLKTPKRGRSMKRCNRGNSMDQQDFENMHELNVDQVDFSEISHSPASESDYENDASLERPRHRFGLGRQHSVMNGASLERDTFNIEEKMSRIQL